MWAMIIAGAIVQYKKSNNTLPDGTFATSAPLVEREGVSVLGFSLPPHPLVFFLMQPSVHIGTLLAPFRMSCPAGRLP